MTSRFLLPLLFLLMALPASGQRWEKWERDFRQLIDRGEYAEAGKVAARQANYCLENLDSTDIRFMRSFYNLGRAYYGMQMWQQARENLALAYNLTVPFYARHGADLADICELYGRTETQLGYHRSAYDFLSYARDVRVALNGKQSREYVQVLYYMADLEIARADWEAMTELLSEALEIHDTYFPKDAGFAKYANYLGLVYMNSGANAEAAATFGWALETYAVSGMEPDFTFAHIQNNLGLARYYLNDFEGAAYHFEQADSAYGDLLEGYSGNYMMLLNNLASLYYSWGKPEQAARAYAHLEAYLADHPGEEGLQVIQAFENAADYRAERGELKAAESHYLEAIRRRENTRPVDRRELAGARLLLATLYYENGAGRKGAETALEALEILEPVCEPGDPDLVTAQFVTGRSYQEADLPNRAIFHYERAREHAEWNGASPSPGVSSLYNNLGVLYLEKQQLSDAIAHLETADRLEPGNAEVYYNLGYALFLLRDYIRAREYFDRAGLVYRERYGEDHPEYADALIQAIKVRVNFERLTEEDLRKIRDAERILLDSGTDSTDWKYIDCLDAYIRYHTSRKEYEAGLGYSRRVLGLTEAGSGSFSLEYLTALMDHALLLTRLPDPEGVSEVYKRAEEILPGLEEADRQSALYLMDQSKAYNLYRLGQFRESMHSMERLAAADKAWYLANEQGMTRNERSEYSRRLVSLVDYYSYLYHFPGDPRVISTVLDNRLFLRSLLTDAEERNRRYVKESGDPALLEWEAELNEARNRLSNLGSQFGADPQLLDSLRQKVDSLDRAISRRIGSQLESGGRNMQWEEVRAALGEGEAAVEIVTFYHRTGEQGTILEPRYFAIYLKPGMASPGFIDLGTGVDLAGEYRDYRASVELPDKPPPGPGIYESLWSPVEQVIGDCRTLYFAPDGIYAELNMEALTDGRGVSVLDKYLIRNVTGLSELLQDQGPSGGNRFALLAGDPSFRVSRAGPDRGPASPGGQETGTASRVFGGTRLTPLPGTRTEVDSLSALLNREGWNTLTLTGEEVTEERLAETENPRILHLATHGFFAGVEDPGAVIRDTARDEYTRSHNYLDPDLQSRSCLFLAGAQNTLFYAYDYESDPSDGILNGWEIESMNLDSTELVVLSACETGLGDAINSEGITGLRRAFRLAGAQRLLLSLWEVDDQATQQLMRLFYSNWLSGMPMDRALAEAKRVLRSDPRFSHPRYWAAFILTGI